LEDLKATLEREINTILARKKRIEEDFSEFISQEEQKITAKIKEVQEKYDLELKSRQKEIQDLQEKEKEVKIKSLEIQKKEVEISKKEKDGENQALEIAAKERSVLSMMEDAQKELKRAREAKKGLSVEQENFSRLLQEIEGQNRQKDAQYETKFKIVIEKERIAEEKIKLAEISRNLFEGKKKWIQDQEEKIKDQWATLLNAQKHFSLSHG